MPTGPKPFIRAIDTEIKLLSWKINFKRDKRGKGVVWSNIWIILFELT